MIGHRCGLLGVHAQAGAHRLRGIVDAPFGRGASGDALDDQVVRHFQLDRDIERLVEAIEQGLEGRALGQVARIAVEDEAALGVWLRNAILEHAEHDLVGDQVSGIHDRLGLEAERRARLDCRTQQVAGRHVWNTQFLLERGRLGAFSRSGCAE